MMLLFRLAVVTLLFVTQGLCQLGNLKLWRSAFKIKREEQLRAVRQVVSLNDYGKQFSMIQAMAEQSMKQIEQVQEILQNDDIGWQIGDDFPTDSKTQELVSGILENTAFFADLSLRLPPVFSKVYKLMPGFEANFRWCIGFSNATGYYDKAMTSLMHILGQELGIVPRELNYENPYYKPGQEQQAPIDEPQYPSEDKKKKKKRVRKRGPSLSGRQEL